MYSYDHGPPPPPPGPPLPPHHHHAASHPNEGGRSVDLTPMENAQGMMKGPLGLPRGGRPHENGSMESSNSSSYRGVSSHNQNLYHMPPHSAHSMPPRQAPPHHPPLPPPPHAMYHSEPMHYFRPQQQQQQHHPNGPYSHSSQQPPPRFSRPLPPPPPPHHHHPHHHVPHHSTAPPPPPPPPPRCQPPGPPDSYYDPQQHQHQQQQVSLEPRLEPRPGASYSSNQSMLLERLIDTHFRIGGCTCKKSRCLKLYCQCFASSTTCGAKCKCQACRNTTANGDLIEDARKTILERNPSAFDDKFRATMTPNPQQQQQQQPQPHPPQPHGMMRHPYAPKSHNMAPSAPPTLTTVESSQSHSTTVVSSPTSAKTSAPPAVAWGNAPPAKSSPSRVNKYGCKCRRSFCLKKYCECFQNSVYCGLNCRCSHCKNFSSDDKSPTKPIAIVATSAAPSMPEPIEKQPPVMVERESPIRVVSNDSAATIEDIKHGSPRADRMAIMAAVAMTELFGGKLSSSDAQEQFSHDLKRKSQEEHDIATVESKRCKTTESPSSPEDEEVRAVVSSSNSMESRNNSPVALIPPPPQPNSSQVGHSSPPSSSYHMPQPRFGGAFHPPQKSHAATSYYAPAPRPQPSPTTVRASPTYEDVVRSSGLPKSLSFRKICSKCGKTRAEHGELGFGNKCVYQDCGKCGAGVQMHRKAHCPMGILCTLTVEEGAIPGAADVYDRKIRDLAARAELQRTLMQRKDQPQPPPLQGVATAIVMSATSS